MNLIETIPIIDAHAHVFAIPHYVNMLVKTMDTCHISKACISGIGPIFQSITNQQVLDLLQTYPDRFIGAYFIRPGLSHPEEIQQAYSAGFRMIKVTLTVKPYDDEELFPLWEEAAHLHMPILFHTGILTTPLAAPTEHISSWKMHPMRLEPIANAFPQLNIIIAHLGVHWNEDAAELIRMRPNVYADLTGEPSGWRKRADHIGMEHYLWWDGAFKKILFGTDVIPTKIPEILQQDRARYQRLHLDEETLHLIFHRNLEKMLHISTG